MRVVRFFVEESEKKKVMLKKAFVQLTSFWMLIPEVQHDNEMKIHKAHSRVEKFLDESFPYLVLWQEYKWHYYYYSYYSCSTKNSKNTTNTIFPNSLPTLWLKSTNLPAPPNCVGFLQAR